MVYSILLNSLFHNLILKGIILKEHSDFIVILISIITIN